MIEKFFDFDGGVDQVGDAAWQFYDCHLKADIGEFKKGAHVGCITVDYEKGWIEVINADPDTEVVKRYAASITIGEEIKANG